MVARLSLFYHTPKNGTPHTLPILGLLSLTTLPSIVNPAVTIEPKTAPYYVPSEQIPKPTPGAFGRPSNRKRRLAARAASKAAKTHRKMIRAKSR